MLTLRSKIIHFTGGDFAFSDTEFVSDIYGAWSAPFGNANTYLVNKLDWNPQVPALFTFTARGVSTFRPGVNMSPFPPRLIYSSVRPPNMWPLPRNPAQQFIGYLDSASIAVEHDVLAWDEDQFGGRPVRHFVFSSFYLLFLLCFDQAFFFLCMRRTISNLIDLIAKIDTFHLRPWRHTQLRSSSSLSALGAPTPSPSTKTRPTPSINTALSSHPPKTPITT
jgi:hypothetical protein